MNGETITLYGDKLVVKNSGMLFNLREGVLKITTTYQFKTTDSPDAKLNIDFRDEIHFDIHTRVESLRASNLIKKLFNKQALLAFGLQQVISLSEDA